MSSNLSIKYQHDLKYEIETINSCCQMQHKIKNLTLRYIEHKNLTLLIIKKRSLQNVDLK